MKLEIVKIKSLYSDREEYYVRKWSWYYMKYIMLNRYRFGYNRFNGYVSKPTWNVKDFKFGYSSPSCEHFTYEAAEETLNEYMKYAEHKKKSKRKLLKGPKITVLKKIKV